MAETLQLLSIISFVVAAVCFVLAVFLCFFFRIPNVIGDLSGHNAKKSIAKMRETNEKTGSKSHKTSKTNAERGKLTETMSGGRKENIVSKTEKPETGLLDENTATSIETESTTVLTSNTTGLLVDEDATVQLTYSKSQTVSYASAIKLVVIDEVMLIHTDEVI